MKQKTARRHKSAYADMQFVTASVSTTLVLLLLGLVTLSVLAARNLSVYVKENISFTIVPDDGMEESDILRLQQQLKAKSYVKQAVYISKEEALREQSEAMGTNPEDFLQYNPFSASIEVNLNASYANADSLARIEQDIRLHNNIEDIIYQKELIDELNENVRAVSLSLLALAALLACISFVLINNTVRLTIYSKRFLIHTMKLVGASWGFIRWPFLRRNLWVGLMAAAVADGLLLGGAYWLVTREPGLIRVLTPEVMLAVAGVVLVAGVVITWLCALLSVNKYLRMNADTLYHI